MLTNLERLILDPISEDSTNAPLEITGRATGSGIYLVSHAYPRAERKTTFAGNRSTIGQRKVAPGLPDTRRIPIVCWVAEEPGIGAATNLFSNPSAEVAFAEYTALGAAAVSRVSTQSRAGEYSVQAVTPATAITGITLAPVTGLAPSTATHLLVVVRAPVGAAMSISLQERTTADVYVGATDTAFVGTGDWQVVKASRTYGATGTRSLAYVYQTDAVARTFHLDGVVLAQGADPLDYFDGDTPGCSWSGTPHASSAARKAAGGKRFVGALNDLEAKIEKLAREGGTLKRVLPSGDSIVFDIQEAFIDGQTDRAFNQGRQEVPLELVCEPLGRGAEYALGADKTVTGSPAAAPVLVAIDNGPRGSYGARGRLLIDNDVSADQTFLAWGIESRYFDKTDPAAKKLLIEAKDMSVLGTSSKVAGAAGAFGSGSNVIRQTDLSPAKVSLLSTQLSSGSVHLQHVGTYRVWARIFRPTSNTGDVTAWLEWTTGDFRSYTPNAKRKWAAGEIEGVWQLVPLGVVKIPPATAGTQRWEGRLVATSTVAGDEIDTNYLWFQPVAEGSGRAVAEPPSSSPTALTARDAFDQTAGALTGKVLPVGGTWTNVTSDDATDFNVSGSGAVTRVATSDADLNTGRLVQAGTTNYAAIEVEAACKLDLSFSGSAAEVLRMGVFARLDDINNYLAAFRINDFTYEKFKVVKRVAGTVTTLATVTVGPILGLAKNKVVKLRADAAGLWSASLDGQEIASGYDADLVTGAASGLDSGKIGVFDAYTTAAALTRTYDNFSAVVPASAAAVFASQSAEIRHNAALRADSAGTVWPEIPGYRGDYLLLPPAGREKRKLRWTVKLTRSDPEVADPSLDALSAQMFATPLYDVVPEPS